MGEFGHAVGPLVALGFLEVEAIQDPVRDRREDDAGRDDDDEAAVERVEPGEELSARVLREVDRTRAAEQRREIRGGGAAAYRTRA